MLDLGATKMSFDRAKVLLVREKEYLKEVKFSMRDQLAVLKAEEVVLMRILQHHEQAAVSQSSTTPHISSPPPSSQPISNTVSITNPNADQLPELNLDLVSSRPRSADVVEEEEELDEDD